MTSSLEQRTGPVLRIGSAARWLRRASGPQLLAFLDQGIVSASSFLVLIMVARWTDAHQVGLYATAMSLVAISMSVLDSLVTRPYAIRLLEWRGCRVQHAASAHALALALSVAIAMALAGVGGLAVALGRGSEIGVIIVVAAVCLPFLLARESLRRFGFAELALGRVLVIDCSAAVLGLAAIAALGVAGYLSAASALAALAAACLVAAAWWPPMAQLRTATRLRETAGTSWTLGRWLLWSQLAGQAESYVVYWISLSIAGAAATGVYAACLSIIALVNPVLFGYLNILTPRYVRVLHDSGRRALARRAAFDALVMGAGGAVFCLVLLLAGDRLLEVLYPGAEYRGQGAVLLALGLGLFAGVIGAPAAVALSTVADNARLAAIISTAAALLTAALVFVLLPAHGLLGAALGVLGSTVLASAVRWLAVIVWIRRAAPEPPPAAAAREAILAA